MLTLKPQEEKCKVLGLYLKAVEIAKGFIKEFILHQTLNDFMC